MKSLHPFLLLALALFVFSCAKDQTTAVDGLQVQNPDVPADIQAIVDEAVAELEHDYHNPPAHDGVSTRGATVTLPAGSSDKLAEAIAQAGVNGKVIVASGDHWESGTVLINHNVQLIGQHGANIYFDIAPEGGSGGPTNALDPALYVKNSNFVRIENLRLAPNGDTGSVGIFLENSRFARIKDNKFVDFEYAIWGSRNSDRASIYDNVISYHETVVTGNGQGGWAIVIESGNASMLKGNKINNYGAAIFASGKYGIIQDNELFGNGIGILTCTVQGNRTLPNGQLLQPAVPCAEWKIMYNDSHDNWWNYLIIDGSNNNLYYRNDSANSGSGIDFYLLGDSQLVGTFTPFTYSNFVVNKAGMVSVDCGSKNTILGGTMNPGPCL